MALLIASTFSAALAAPAPATNLVTDLEALSPTYGLNTLLAAAKAAGLLNTLMIASTDLTLFAPTDAAFDAFLKANNLTAAQLLADKQLANILLAHTVKGTVKSTDLNSSFPYGNEFVSQSSPPTALDVFFFPLSVDGAVVIKADALATNGVIHVIDKVLPLPAAPPPRPPVDNLVTDLEALSPTYGLNTLLAAAKAAGLLNTLMIASTNLTLFAPTDAAFDAFLKANNLTAAQLLADKQLANILLAHTVKGTVKSTDLKNGEVADSQSSPPTALKFDVGAKGVFVDGAHVIIADALATNGVIHVIDKVLPLPAASVVEAVALA